MDFHKSHYKWCWGRDQKSAYIKSQTLSHSLSSQLKFADLHKPLLQNVIRNKTKHKLSI